ncbi:MAG: DUF4197 domain-containing protein [Pseudomonadota bacterium]
MNRFRFQLLLCGILVATMVSLSHAGLGDLVNQAKDTLAVPPKASTGNLSDTDMTQGLKEALNVGTGNAVELLSRTDGFYADPNVKILLPDAVRKVEGLLKAVGYGEQVTAFEQSMNRAAERAVPEAKSLFVNAITEMTFQDAEKILRGRENEATLFFKEKTSGRLRELFKPIAHDAMGEVGVTKNYQDLNEKLGTIPMGSQLNLDLDGYVTEKTLDGLFFMIAREEKQIRQNPAARVTDILKKVFK